tara:strand:+ start:6402 stop:9449 length:3048 start_codon:yes stop_codon:yes gene_type:complete
MSDKKIIIKIKTINYLGSKFTYINASNLATKLKVSKSTAERLIKDYKEKKTTRYIVSDDEIFRINMKQPLIAQKFNKPVSNNKLIGGGSFNNSKVFTGGVKGIPIKLSLSVKFSFIISKNRETRTIGFPLTIDPSNLTDEVILAQTMNAFDAPVINGSEELISYTITSLFTKEKFDLKKMKLFDSEPIRLDNLFSNIVYNNEWNDCVIDFLKFQYPRLSKKKIDKLRTTEDIKQWAIDSKVKLRVFDIEQNLIEVNDVRESRKKILAFVAYNNHLYPIDSASLQKVPCANYIVKIVENASDEFVKVLSDGHLPSNVNIYHTEIKGFIHNNIKYVENPDYERCKEILEMFTEYFEEGKTLQNYLTTGTTFFTLGSIISKFFVEENVKSFLPNHEKFVKGGYNYHNEDIKNDEEDFLTIDKNKCYTSNLYSLGHLLTTDIRSCKHIIYDDENPCSEIITTSLYIANPKYSSILIPNCNLYCGITLEYAKREGVEFEILEELKTEIKPNYFEPMIDALKSKVTESEFKMIMNIFIGKMEQSKEISDQLKFRKICNVDEAKRTTGYKMPISTEKKKVVTIRNEQYTLKMQHDPTHYIISDEHKSFNLYSMKPISVQIKDSSRMELYRMMQSLDLNTNDVKQIKTDSITFLKKNDIHKCFINKKLTGWKMEEYCSIKHNTYSNQQVSFYYDEPDNKNCLFDCLAGAGKTHIILNQIIPTLGEDYLVVTPSHASIRDYRKEGKNCNVIQSYTFSKEMPEANTIIIDEIGMVDRNGWDFIYKCSLLGKRILAFGDFKQLAPYGGKLYNQKLFLNKIFNINYSLKTNYRNNFTEKYYYDLINSKVKNFLIEEVVKYNTDWEHAEVIIGFRNETVDKYNAEMCKINKIKNLYDRHAKIKCAVNNKSLIKLGIYNNFIYTVLSKDDNNVLITDGQTEINVPVRHSKDSKDYYSFTNKFKYAYARTLYGVQGDTLNSIHYCYEDMQFINGRTAYTAISRLKQKLNETQNKRNKTNEFFLKYINNDN